MSCARFFNNGPCKRQSHKHNLLGFTGWKNKISNLHLSFAQHHEKSRWLGGDPKLYKSITKQGSNKANLRGWQPISLTWLRGSGLWGGGVQRRRRCWRIHPGWRFRLPGRTRRINFAALLFLKLWKMSTIDTIATVFIWTKRCAKTNRSTDIAQRWMLYQAVR